MSYDRDPVVEEVRKVREKIMKEFAYDLHAFGRFLAERERKRRRKPIRMPRRREAAALHTLRSSAGHAEEAVHA